MSTPTPTPRTDAEAADGWETFDMGGTSRLPNYCFKKDVDGDWVPSDFARTLERELAAAKARAEKAEAERNEVRLSRVIMSAELAQVKARVRGLESALKEAREHVRSDYWQGQDVQNAGKCLDAALARVAQEGCAK